MKISLHPFKVLSAVGALAALVHAGDYSSWGSYRPVTLSTSGMGLSAPVTDFPVSVRFKASAHADMLNNEATQAQPDGSDIRVTLADGTTDVPFEIEHISVGDSTGVLHMWILAENVPANSSSAASFRVYWGKEGEESMSDPEATFPTGAGFQAVFHMNDSGSTITNAANSALNGEATGTSVTTGETAAQGYVSAKSGLYVRAFGSSGGGEDNSTPVEDYIKLEPGPGHDLNNHNGPLTMEGWVYSSIANNGNVSPGAKHIIAQGDGHTGGNAWFARTAALDGSGSTPPDLSGQNHYSAGGPNTTQGPIAPWGEQHHWQYVAAVWNGTSYTIYRQREGDPWNNPTVSGPEGMLPDSAFYKSYTGTAPTASDMPWYIGAASNDSINGDDSVMTRGWHGWMEEVRISTVARDSNYVKLNFLTARNDSLPGVIHPVTIGATEAPTISGPYAAWSGHRTITLNTSETGANVDEDVENFPVLIRLGEAEGAILAAADDGNSIRFTKADNETPLPYEIESWSEDAAAIWVLVDEIEGDNATQTIRMHWGNDTASDLSDGAAVFDNAHGHAAVFHLGGTDDETPRPNAVSGGNPATPVNLPEGYTPRMGIIAGSDSLGGDETGADTEHLSFGPLPVGTFPDGEGTISLWVKPDAFNPGWASHAVSLGSGTPSHNFWMGRFGNEEQINITARTANASTEGPALNSPDNATEGWTVGEWQLVHVSLNEPDIVIYKNGEQVASGAGQFLVDAARTSAFIGRALWGDPVFGGAYDEVRIASEARSAAWAKLEYENQKAVNSLVDIGIPLLEAPTQPTNVMATGDTAKIVVSWTAPSDNGGSPITGYKAMVVGDTARACTVGADTLTCEISATTAAQLEDTVTIVVRANNAIGPGPNSAASNQVTPLMPDPPSAPQDPEAVVNGPSSITVSWTAPTSTGGSPITSYTVTGSPSGSCSTTELTCTVTGLAQGTEYTFTVTASNIAGAGAASEEVSGTTTGLLGAFVIHMDGARNPYTYRMPAASVDATETLTMIISDVQGKRIWSRTINPASSKIRELTWNGRTSKGQAVAPGLYVVRIKAEMSGKVIEATKAGIRQ